MKRMWILIIVLQLSATAFAQDSLNCRLVSNTGNLVNAYGLTVKDNFVFTVSSKFSILDISDLTNPWLAYSDSVSPNINSVAVEGSYAYLGADDGLLILNISSVQAPEVLSYLKTDKYIEEVEVRNNTAYLGTLGSAFLVIDVTDPRNPREISRVDENIDDVWGIDVKDTLLFAAAEDSGLKIFSVNDPSKPVGISATIVAPQGALFDVKVKDTIAYITHTRDLYAYNISDPSNPEFVYYLPGAGGSIMLEDDYAYCATFNKLTVVDISNPAELKVAGYYPIKNWGSDIYVKNKIAYVPCQDQGVYFIRFDTPTTLENNSLPVMDFSLLQNYPNPFNPTTVIKYQIPGNDFIALTVYDILGNEVANLVDEYQHAGVYEVSFNGGNLPSGVYFCSLKSGRFLETKKMLLMK